MNIKVSELMYGVSFALDCVEKDLLKVTTNHTKRVAYLCILTATYLGMGADEVIDLACAGILHDNALTEYILSEGGKAYNKEVWETNLASHCVLGEKNVIDFPFTTDTDNFILYHHENADGTGAFKKTENEIPLGAKIIRICDNVDALFALGKYEKDKLFKVCVHVRENEGKLYPKEVTDAFLAVISDLVLANLSNDIIDQTLNEITPNTEREVPLDALIGFSTVLSKIVDYKSHFTKEHSYQIAQKAKRMAEYYNFYDNEIKQFYLAAALHDLGKLAVPVSILEKPGSLTDDEFEIMKKHALNTYEMLSKIKGLETVTVWASNHHEKLDGCGYPFGKKAEELDFNSRLLTCIDIYQALTERRPYRDGMSHSQTMTVLYQMGEAGVIERSIVKDLDMVLGGA